MLKFLDTLLNLVIAATGLELVMRLLVTYNDPIRLGALWIVLICAQRCLDIFKKEDMDL